MKHNLYIFSAVYPYNIMGDCFLEDELEYISRYFDSIIIIPYTWETDSKKGIPDNYSVLPPILSNKFSFILKGIFSFTGFKLLFPELFNLKVFTSRKRLITWIKAYSFMNNLCHRNDIMGIGDNLSKNDVCYFYWGKWSNLLSVLWKGKTNIVSRFHGEWDLWEESSGGCVPLRSQVADSLDIAVFISKKGEKYFKERYRTKRTVYAPLGSRDFGVSEKSTDGIIRILSCSSIYPLKRVSMIYDCVNRFAASHEVLWTHIGGGEDELTLKERIKNTANSNLKATITGIKPHDYVVDYYQHNQVDLFINLSTSEGIPVSIMEAISCGIPVVATNVGGNSEIVTDETGVIVSDNPSIEEVCKAIEIVLNHNYDTRSFWNSYYNADVNYSRFALELNNL